jgi:hypothetical protein
MRIFEKLFGIKPKEPDVPDWHKDDEFMAWLKTTRPAEEGLVRDGVMYRKHYDDSTIGLATTRTVWRWEGWKSRETYIRDRDVGEEENFERWHNENYPKDKDDQDYERAKNYKRAKKRRLQGWLGFATKFLMGQVV